MGGHLGLCPRWLWLELGFGNLPLAASAVAAAPAVIAAGAADATALATAALALATAAALAAALRVPRLDVGRRQDCSVAVPHGPPVQPVRRLKLVLRCTSVHVRNRVEPGVWHLRRLGCGRLGWGRGVLRLRRGGGDEGRLQAAAVTRTAAAAVATLAATSAAIAA